MISSCRTVDSLAVDGGNSCGSSRGTRPPSSPSNNLLTGTSAVPSLLLICSHIARQISMIKRFVLLTIEQMGWMLFVTLLLSLYLGQRRMRWNILFGYHQQCGAFDQLLGVWFLAGFFAVNGKGRLFKKRLERFLMGDCMTIN